MRFREIMIQDSNMPDFFQLKGKQYIEKIIQFQVNLPPRSNQDIKRFISSQFPRWTIASDIINIGVGGNPRRLIHHCNSLSYYYRVYENIYQDELGRTITLEKLSLVDKILALSSLDKDLTKKINLLLKNDEITSEIKNEFFR